MNLRNMKDLTIIRSLIITIAIVLTFGIVLSISKPTEQQQYSSRTLFTQEILEDINNVELKQQESLNVTSGKLTLFDTQENNNILSQDCTSVILDKHFLLEGPIVAANPFHGCDKIENTHLITNQTIVLVSDYWVYSCHPKKKIKNVQDTGAAGIIIARNGGEGGGGFLAHWMWPEDKSWVNINGVETASSRLEKMVQKNTQDLDSDPNATSYYVTVSPGVNQYEKMRTPGFHFSMALNAAESALTLGLAIYKLRGFVLFYGFEPSVTQICLSLEIVSSTLRLIGWVDPLFSRGIYPYGVGVFWMWLVQPFLFGILLLVAFYWEQSISRVNLQAMPALRRFRYLFFLLCFIIALCYWINGIVRALFLSQHYPVVPVNVLVNGLICFGVAIFYIIVGCKVIRFLWSQKSLSGRSRDLRATTFMIMLSAALLILFNIFAFAFLTQPKIKAVVSLFMIEFHLSNLIALSLVLAFRPPRPSGTSSNQQTTSGGSKRDVSPKFSRSTYSSARSDSDMEMQSQRQSKAEPEPEPEPTPTEPQPASKPEPQPTPEPQASTTTSAGTSVIMKHYSVDNEFNPDFGITGRDRIVTNPGIQVREIDEEEEEDDGPNVMVYREEDE